MRILLTVLGIWLLINVLFVIVMLPPRKPRRRSKSDPREGQLATAPIDRDGASAGDDPPPSLRHVIIAIALGALFSLTPPLLEGYDALSRRLRQLRGKEIDESGSQPETLESIFAELRKEYEEKHSDESEDGDANKR